MATKANNNNNLVTLFGDILVRFYHCSAREEVKRGFILAVTVWMVAILGLAGAVINQWTVRTLDQAIKYRDQAEALRQISQIRQDLIYALATGDRSPAGMSPLNSSSSGGFGPMAPTAEETEENDVEATPYTIRFDGTPYAVGDGSNAVLQAYDARGLISVSELTDREMSHLLSLFGADPDQQQTLVNRLRDYTDKDDLIRLNGAEAQQYERFGRPAPPNDRLWAVEQLRHIPGWDEIAPLWEAHEKEPLLSACRVAGFNPNTAVKRALEVYAVGLTSGNLQRVLDRRVETPFRNVREFSTETEVARTIEPIRFIPLPSDCLTADVAFPDYQLKYRFILNLRIQNKTIPWELLSLHRLPYTDDNRTETTRERLVFSSPSSSI